MKCLLASSFTLMVSGAAPDAGRPLLRGSKTSTPSNISGLLLNITSSTSRAALDPVASAFGLINSENGVLVHGIAGGAAINGAMDGNGGWFDWSTQFGDIRAINDCWRQDNQDCSAWAYIQKDLMPILYNYPDQGGGMQHAVGLMRDRNSVSDRITKLHVIDADTWHRLPGGVHEWDSLKDAVQDATNIPYVCVPAPPDNGDITKHYDPFYNKEAGQFEAYVGKNGEYWPQIFQDVRLTKKYTMIRQCNFDYHVDGHWDAWRGALFAFYERAKEQVFSHTVGDADNTPDKNLYLENEVNVNLNAADMDEWSSGILAVTVQDNWCVDQLKYDWTREELCSAYYGDSEGQVIAESLKAACRISNQLSHKYERWIPVIKAGFLSNAIVDLDAWNNFAANGASAESYMEGYDCCDSYSDVYDYNCAGR
jgi:hypothetical protein